MKTCFKCGETKPRSEYYRHPQMGDGLLGKCKECTKKDSNTHRTENADKVREYDRTRYLRPHRKAAHREQAKLWTARNRDGNLAHQKLHRAILAGKIQRQPCSECGRPDSHAHHPDYSKPFDVMWLCPVHHSAQHKLEGRIPAGERWDRAEA